LTQMMKKKHKLEIPPGIIIRLLMWTFFVCSKPG
jgi:hypothetical protein